MSTRAVIARKAGDGFKGVYHHWDGYPTALGATLFNLAQVTPLDELLETLIDKHPAGWSTINDKDFSKAPRYVSIGALVQGNQPQCYCHGDRQEEANTLTESNASEVGCEYAYVFDLEKRVLYVLGSFSGSKKMIGMFGMGDENAIWKCMSVVKLDEPEPNWKEIEEGV